MKPSSIYDTIAAISTPPGEGGIGVIRVSGEKSLDVARKFFRKPDGKPVESFRPRYAYFGMVVDSEGREIDRGIGIYFQAPSSYTGEDVFEFQLHGSPVILNKLLEEILDAGVRLAEPGEFTKRAFLNGKIDLLQAEGVIDLIQAYSEKAAENARRLLEGELSSIMWEIRDTLKEVLLHLEAAIDFPEEDLELEEYPQLIEKLKMVDEKLKKLLNSYLPGRIFQYGAAVTLVGAPNVGKSHLLNRLLRRERAIVSEVPGTTRDFIEEKTLIAGIPVRLVDTAGIRETSDPVEKTGIEFTLKKVGESDLVLFIFDSSREPHQYEIDFSRQIPEEKRIVVLNKSDIAVREVVEKIKELYPESVVVSALTGENIEKLEEKIKEKIKVASISADVMLTSERQYRLVKEAELSISRSIEEMVRNSPAEFVALEVRAALERIGELTGEFYTEELLEEIFDRFCIGK